MGNCTGIKYKFFSGSWSGWNTTLKGGYAGWKGSGSNRVVVLQFKTPAKSSSYNGYYDSKVVMKIPFLEDQGGDTIYAKCQTSDPTYDPGNMTICAIPTASTATASYTFSGGNSQYRTATFTIKDLKPSTLYYVILGTKGSCGSNVQIGPGNDSHKYDFNFTYTGYTNGTKPIGWKIVDNGDNTFKITGTRGTAGTNNKIEEATLYYTTNGNVPKAGSSYTAEVDLGTTSGDTYTSDNYKITTKCTVKAIVQYHYKYNNTSTGTPDTTDAIKSKTIIFYKNPTHNSGKVPVLDSSSFKNNRLTLKQDWKYNWSGVFSAGNTDTPIKQFRVRLFKGTSKQPIALSGSTLIKGTSTYVDVDAKITSLSFDPTTFGFEPNNTVKLGLYAKAKNGAGTDLWNGGGATEAQVYSIVSPVENAGVVHVNTSTTSTPNFVEGIVYVYTGTGSTYDASKWVEAELVQVCTDGVNKKWTDAI